jgi:hypothetical protein
MGTSFQRRAGRRRAWREAIATRHRITHGYAPLAPATKIRIFDSSSPRGPSGPPPLSAPVPDASLPCGPDLSTGGDTFGSLRLALGAMRRG